MCQNWDIQVGVVLQRAWHEPAFYWEDSFNTKTFTLASLFNYAINQSPKYKGIV